MVGLSYILNERNDSGFIPDIIIDDDEVLNALEMYMRGKELRKESEDLIDKAREILDRKLYNNKVMRSESDDLIVEISEYNTTVIDSKALKSKYKEIYDECSSVRSTHRYNFIKKS